jgi:peptidyl-prolyl cis-trans isomerase D
MLQAINDRIKGWLGIVIVILIGLPFALWGINSYFDDAGPRYAAKVNNIEISARELERTVSLQRQRMLREYDGKLPVDEKVLRERTLTQLVNQRLLEGAAYDKGYRISDLFLAERIKQQFTVDGVFDRARFEVSVASLGMSVPMYEDALRNELRVKQMQSAIANSAFVTNKDLKDLAALSEQTRDISVLTFDVEHFSTAAKPTEEEIKQYYHENKQRFMLPEKVKVDYVEITSQSLADNVEIDEAQIKQMYDDYVASISGREERKVSHILLQTSDDKNVAKEKILTLKQEIDGGADFADLAKKHSEDTVSAAAGGELGWVALGEMSEPFEKALFDMSLSEDGKETVSDVVETQFGFHLIKLEGVRSETVEPMEAKRYAFEQELKEEAAASLFYDLSERLASIAYENPDNLDVVVEELGLEIKSSDEFTRFNGTGISADENVRRVAFSPLVLEQGSNSDIIEISPAHVIVLRLNEHTPEVAIPLETVTSQIEKSLVAKNGLKQTKAAALEVKAKIEAGENIESFKADGISLEAITSLSRNDTSKVSSPAILHNAFDISPSPDGKPSAKVVDLISGGVALVVLTSVNSPQEVSKEQLALVKSGIERQNATSDFATVLSAIKSNAKIETNKRLLDK